MKSREVLLGEGGGPRGSPRPPHSGGVGLDQRHGVVPALRGRRVVSVEALRPTRAFPKVNSSVVERSLSFFVFIVVF